jgi:hypothetical protein
MEYSPFPLIVGCVGGITFAYPENYESPSGRDIVVVVIADCSICFKNQNVIPNKDHKGPAHYTWTPMMDGTDTFSVEKYRGCPGEHVTKTYSIKVGSRLKV